MDTPEFVKITVIVETPTARRTTVFEQAQAPTIGVGDILAHRDVLKVSLEFKVKLDDWDRFYTTHDEVLEENTDVN